MPSALIMPSWNCASAEFVSAARGGALEQRARLRLVLANTLAGRERDAELDHGRGAALVGGLAIGRDRLRCLLARRIGAAELIERAARRRRGDAAILDRRRNV